MKRCFVRGEKMGGILYIQPLFWPSDLKILLLFEMGLAIEGTGCNTTVMGG